MSSSDKRTPILRPEATLHYEKVDEASRLLRAENEIELVRTRELLTRYLPPPPAAVLDVGGGAGIHAFWLAEQGHHVHLIDAVPRHIEQAREAARQSEHPPVTMDVGDACCLNVADSSSDALLLFGPLYHLTEREARITCLREARRVLRRGGIVMAVGISRFISTINCLSSEMIDDGEFQSVVAGDLQDGQHRNPTADHNPAFFTTTFFHHPAELRDEITTAGFRLDNVLAVEGPARLLPNFAEHWSDDRKREWLLDMVRKVESEPHLLGVSTHLMAAGYK